MTPTVLVTGSLGYIGSRLTEWLAAADIRCIGYDTGFFDDCTLYPPSDPETVRKDVREIGQDDLAEVDVVVHLAGISNDPFGHLSPETVYDPTRAYTFRLVKLCKEMGIRFIFPSSCSVYGVGGDDLLTEETRTAPQTPYSLNKVQIEDDLGDIAGEGFSPIILRLATVYGLSPRMRFDVVVNMLTAMAATTGKIVLNSDGQAWRPHVHIDDVARAVEQCIRLTHIPQSPLVMNVGDTKQNLRIIEVAEMVAEQVPGSEIVFMSGSQSEADGDASELIRDLKVQDGVDKRTYNVSFELIKETLPGFRCGWTVERGIRSMLDAFVAMDLSQEQLGSVQFYRLQQMESLLESRSLSADLRWQGAIDDTSS
jgi:nucleoside-diphosphate-sugar epimerase